MYKFCTKFHWNRFSRLPLFANKHQSIQTFSSYKFVRCSTAAYYGHWSSIYGSYVMWHLQPANLGVNLVSKLFLNADFTFFHILFFRSWQWYLIYYLLPLINSYYVIAANTIISIGLFVCGTLMLKLVSIVVIINIIELSSWRLN